MDKLIRDGAAYFAYVPCFACYLRTVELKSRGIIVSCYQRHFLDEFELGHHDHVCTYRPSSRRLRVSSALPFVLSKTDRLPVSSLKPFSMVRLSHSV